MLIYDERTITHLVGYLKPEQWADAINQVEDSNLDEKQIYDLMKEQERVYSFKLIEEVEEILAEKGD